MTVKNALLMLALLAMMTATACAQTPRNLPEPVQAMQERGVRIVGTFEVAGGLTGYAGFVDQRPIAIYVTADGEHAIVGYMINGEGRFVHRKTLQQMVVEPMSKRIWSKLENSAWVPDGDADAPRTVYVFTDPNCPYCHMFWKRARPWVESGKVQLRHILVGVIAKSSANKAAAILTAENPEQALTRNEHRFAEGGITPMEEIPEEIRRKLKSNLQLMRQLGLRGTPSIVYRDSEGRVQFWRGVPPKQAMSKVLGPR